MPRRPIGKVNYPTPSPTPMGRRVEGNIDLTNRPSVRMPDGSYASVRTMGIGDETGEIVIPTVSDRGEVMSDQDAVNQYRKTGRHFGKFDSILNASNYAQQLHLDQEALGRHIRTPTPGAKPVPGSKVRGEPTVSDLIKLLNSTIAPRKISRAEYDYDFRRAPRLMLPGSGIDPMKSVEDRRRSSLPSTGSEVLDRITDFIDHRLYSFAGGIRGAPFIVSGDPFDHNIQSILDARRDKHGSFWRDRAL